MSSLPPASSTTTTTTATRRRPRQQRPKPNKPPVSGRTGTGTTIDATSQPPPHPTATLPPPSTTSTASKGPSKSQIRNAKRRNHQKQRKAPPLSPEHAWRAQIPTDSVDPITLESLSSLPYPPFALVASPPYTPIDWPPLSTTTTSTTTTCTIHDHDDPPDVPGRTEEERQRQILEAQWGKSLRVSNDHANLPDDAPTNVPTTTTTTTPAPLPPRHVNLYDGRALAYYMVSQLQFIDPLNRRDITRDELIHLDQYLRRYDFHELNVVEAYDTKGVTLSSAGAVANTARGRTMILQQEAQALLNALFGGHTVSRPLPPVSSTTTTTTNTRNTFMEQYEAREATHRRTLATSSRPLHNPAAHSAAHDHSHTEHSIMSNALTDSGMVIIDDDENPGLRGNASTYPLLYSAHHIATRHGRGVGGNSQSRPVPEQEFPLLSATVPPSIRTTQPEPAATSISSAAPKILPKAKTLSKISKMVKQTNPEEQHRQWEAREEARRKAMMANLTFGSNPTLPTTSEATQSFADGIPSQITTMTLPGPSLGQIERNRALAEALGVPPAPLRSTGGWARPTERTGPSADEGCFADEVNHTIYPDSLIKNAKELRLDMILKLEKKWKLFLNDDKAASLPLYPMDRTHRAFVHEYAGYWKLHTESFDPEPKRYVHCVKLLETFSPYPLLSEAMKHWSPNVRSNNNMHHHNTSGAAVSTVTALSMDHSTNQTSGQCTTSSEQRLPTREFPIDAPHQRIPLSLQKRTLPLELPPYDNTNAGSTNAVALDLNVVHLQQQERHEQKVRKQQEKEQRKQRALQSAFASDDDEESDSSDDESEWEEKVAIYHSSSSGSDE